MIKDLFVQFYGQTGLQVISFIVSSAIYWLPPVLAYVLLKAWTSYVRLDYLYNEKYLLLEIKLPRELTKSPQAMEIFFSSLFYEGGESTFIDRGWAGKTRPWWSLELVSLEGQVHFYIWTRAFFKNMIQAQIYAQYPSVEIHEADDYTRGVYYNNKTMSMWGCYFRKDPKKPYAYPIKTYIDYGLDKTSVEEEEKIDPMAAVLEYLSSVGKGEQIWLQIIVRAHRKERPIPDLVFNKTDWKDAAKIEIDKLMKRDKKPKKGEKETINFGEFLLTKGERSLVEAMERNTSKLPFDCGIRGMYIAKNENFNAIAIPGLIGSFRQYSARDLNAIAFYDWTDYDYPWQDFRNMRKDYMKRKILAAYKERSFFHLPYKKKPFVLSSEELATIFHLPGKAVETPSLNRVVSRKAEAPANLPV
ncbi:MAG: hypothetical protein WC673_00890 [Candidatus Paceibacterota bacterium]|jgi:hypothetical protein